MIYTDLSRHAHGRIYTERTWKTAVTAFLEVVLQQRSRAGPCPPREEWFSTCLAQSIKPRTFSEQQVFNQIEENRQKLFSIVSMLSKKKNPPKIKKKNINSDRERFPTIIFLLFLKPSWVLWKKSNDSSHLWVKAQVLPLAGGILHNCFESIFSHLCRVFAALGSWEDSVSCSRQADFLWPRFLLLLCGAAPSLHVCSNFPLKLFNKKKHDPNVQTHSDRTDRFQQLGGTNGRRGLKSNQSSLF